MKKYAKIGIIGIVIVALGGAAYGLTRPKSTYETQKTDRGPVVELISVTGSIAASSKITLQPEVSGRITQILVAEAQAVKAGGELIKLDSRDAEARVASQSASVAAARAQLRQLQAGATAEELNVAKTAVDTAKSQAAAAVAAKADAETALTNARKNLDNTQAKTEALEQSKVNALLNDYESSATTAMDAVNRLTSPLFNGTDQLSFMSSDSQAESNAISSRLAARVALNSINSAVAAAKADGTADGAKAQFATVSDALTSVKAHVDACAKVLNYAPYLSATTLATYQANVSAAQGSLNNAINLVTADKSGLDLQLRLNDADITAAQINESNAEAQVTAAANNINTTASAVDQAQANYDLQKTGARPEAVDAQRAQVAAAEATLASLRADLSKRTILAPVDAIVTDLPFNPGETVAPGQTIVTLQTKDHFEIKANISEVDIAKVKVGDPVSMTLDAFNTGEIWTGKVVSIQPAEKVVEGVIFYETKIVFDKEDERLRSGMTANLDIETNRRDNALRVPIRAVKEKDGVKTVDVLVNGQPVTKEFKAGLSSNDYVEVLSGLAEGEDAIISTGKK